MKMKAVGVIVEYNPFHNGHAYHLQAAKEASGADIIIAVMSGNFLQRGEPALLPKWYRTRMALLNGVDLVIELPYQFATQKAERFATGAVSLLNEIGCSDLCFGSESGDITSFLQTLDFIEKHQEAFNEKVKQNMKTGVSYPKACDLSFQALSDAKDLVNLTKPNNILGFQYIKAIIQQKSTIKPITIKRLSADYHDEHFSTETIASATSIRKALFSADKEDTTIDRYIPSNTSRLLKEYHEQYETFHEWENYWRFLQFRLLQCSPNELREVYEVEEGLENRLIAAAKASSSFKEFMQKIKTKRYTWTRLQRVCLHILTNTKKTERVMHSNKASYLRLLGMTKNGKEYLNRNKSHLSLPLIAKLSSYKQNDIALDINASQIYSLGVANHLTKKLLELEYRQPPIFIQ